jgi:hypothetical protein
MFNMTFSLKPIELNLNETLALLSGYQTTYNMSENINISIRNIANAKNISFEVLCLSSNNATKANLTYNSFNYLDIPGDTLEN